MPGRVDRAADSSSRCGWPPDGSGAPPRRHLADAHARGQSITCPRPASTNSVIASKSITSVLTRRRPGTRRCSATWAGLNSNTSQPVGPPIVQHRAVVMASRLHTYLDLPGWRDNGHHLRAAAANPERVITNSTGPSSRFRAPSVTDNIAEVLPTSTATTIVDDVTGATLHRHNNTSGACQENPECANTQVLKRNHLTDPFLTPPEAFVKD